MKAKVHQLLEPAVEMHLHAYDYVREVDPADETGARTAIVAQTHAGKLASAKRNDYTPQFPIRLMSKDFTLISTLAATVNFAEVASGREEDVSAVIRSTGQAVGVESVLAPVA